MDLVVILDSDSEPEDDLQITSVNSVRQQQNNLDDLEIVGSNSAVGGSSGFEEVELVDEVILDSSNDDIEITGQNILSSNDDDVEVIREEMFPQENVIFLPGNRTIRISGPPSLEALRFANSNSETPTGVNNSRFQQYQTGQRRVLRGRNGLDSRRSRYNIFRSNPRFFQRLSRRLYDNASSGRSGNYLRSRNRPDGDINGYLASGQLIREIYTFVSSPDNEVLDPSGFEPRDDGIPYSVLEQIDRDNNAILNRKFQEHKNFSKPYLEKANKRIGDLPDNYTTDLRSLSDNTAVVCPVCGVVLGEGISSDFKSLFHIEREKKLADPTYKKIDYDDAKIFESQTQIYNCPAPYQLVPDILETDKLSSKKVFFSRCGHVYCGRCVNNIVNRQKVIKNSKRNIQNPLVYGPKRCVAEKCNKGLKLFIELFN